MSIKNEIINYIKSGETDSKSLGLEIEHLVINDKGLPIGFDEISGLIASVGESMGARLIYTDGHVVGYFAEGYTITLEPSCQFEISIDPYEDLSKIERIYTEFRKLWDKVFADAGYHMAEYENLPLVENGTITPDDIPLSPKKRYKYMNEHFESRGKYGKYMMRASASTQISVDFSSEEDMVKKLRALTYLSPIIALLMESKADWDATLKEHPEKKHLLRIQEWEDLDSARTGFIPGSGEDGFGYGTAADVILNTPLILLTDEGETLHVGDKSALDLINEGALDFDGADKERQTSLIEHIISMGFFHMRVKKYIEIRIADSVPIKRAVGYMALIKGLFYSKDNLEKLNEDFKNLDETDACWAFAEAEKYGFAAKLYNDRKACEWADYILNLAAQALDKDDKRRLDYVRDFWTDFEKNNRRRETS